MGKRESGIQERTVARLMGEFRPRIVVRVKHGTAFAVVGDPDIYGCITIMKAKAYTMIGRMFVFEVKNEEGKLTNIQIHRLKEFQAAGAIIGAIDNPDDAVRIIRKAMYA